MKLSNLLFKFDHAGPYFFKNVNLSCEPGTISFIQGENGIGKSTLFSVLKGTMSSNAYYCGEVQLDGIVYKLGDQELLAKIHTVHQNYDSMLADQFTFVENLQFANMRTYPGMCKLAEPLLFDCFEDLMRHASDLPVAHLSGGQRQMLALAMALQKPTKILLLDEPTATLDSENSALVMRILKQLAKNLSLVVLIICHDKELVASYAKGGYFLMQKNLSGIREIAFITL